MRPLPSLLPWALAAALLLAGAGCRMPSAPASGDDDPHLPQVPAPVGDPAVPFLHPWPWTEVEAETGPSSGTWPPATTALHTPGAEASGRRYVSLDPGQAVTLVSPGAADSLVVRYSFPDSSDGAGRDGRLLVAGPEGPWATLALTSQTSWEYGTPHWGGSDVWSDLPAQGRPRHFWDEVSWRGPRWEAGTPVVITNPASQAETVLVDLVDFELMAEAVEAPAGSVNFADYHPDATGEADVSSLLRQALAAASGRTLFVPEGTYRIGSVTLGSGTLQGAGMWRTRFVGPESQIRFGGGLARVADLALWGTTAERNDTSDRGNGLAGVPASGSKVERVWIEHKKCAFWFGNWGQAVGPTGITLEDCRFRNLMADAVNLCSGTRNTVVRRVHVRNSGDDALAAWSPQNGGPSGGSNTFEDNLIQGPWVASGLALYGGGPFTVTGNDVRDTVTTGSGIYVASLFGSHSFTGTITLEGNLLVRAGAHQSDPGGPTGAFRFLAGEAPLASATFVVHNNRVVAPLESAVSIQGPWSVGWLAVDGLTVEGLGSLPVADVRPNGLGACAFTNVSTPGVDTPAWRNASPNFNLTHP